MKNAILFVAVAFATVGCAKKQQQVAETQDTYVEQTASAEQAKAATKSGTEGGERTNATPIYFAYDSSELEQDARIGLSRLAKAMSADESLTLTIEGHCDDRGATEYNLALGERRAKAAREYLNRLGVPDARVSLISYGEERPAVDGEGETAWSKNRRDEFVLSSD